MLEHTFSVFHWVRFWKNVFRTLFKFLYFLDQIHLFNSQMLITYFGIFFFVLNAQLIQIQNYAETDINNCTGIMLSNITSTYFCDISEIGISTKYSCSNDYYIQYASFDSGFSLSIIFLIIFLIVFYFWLIWYSLIFLTFYFFFYKD